MSERNLIYDKVQIIEHYILKDIYWNKKIWRIIMTQLVGYLNSTLLVKIWFPSL